MYAKHKKGFTLIEVMVSIAIMIVILSIALFNHREFGNTIKLTNLAYDVALSVRQAQVYGISVRQTGTGSDPFEVPYGVYFFVNDTDIDYVFFADEDGTTNIGGEVKTGDGEYHRNSPPTALACQTDTTELCEGFTLPTGFIIKSIMGYSTEGNNSGLEFHITFRRPEPNARLEDGTLNRDYYRIDIELESPEGLTKTVSVHENGNITVN